MSRVRGEPRLLAVADASGSEGEHPGRASIACSSRGRLRRFRHRGFPARPFIVTTEPEGSRPLAPGHGFPSGPRGLPGIGAERGGISHRRTEFAINIYGHRCERPEQTIRRSLLDPAPTQPYRGDRSKKRFFSRVPIVTITTTPPLGTLAEGTDNPMLRPCRLLLVVIALNLPMAARTGEPVPQLTGDGSSIGPALEWKQATPSPFARVESPAAVVKGDFYLFGGFTEDLNASNRVDVYDPATDTWNRKKDMPVGVTHLNAVVDGDNIWLAGGFKGKHPGPITDEVWKYDIASDRWAPGPPLPEPRAGGGLAVVEHRLHYFGGYLADRDTNAGDHWSVAIEGGKNSQREPDLPDPRGHLGSAVLEGKIYALGGDHGHDVQQIDVRSCHRFDPKMKKWSDDRQPPGWKEPL